MAETREDEIRQLVERVYRAESGRILATLIRLLGDFDLAEDAMQDAFAAALVRRSRDGAPENPRAWLVSTGRFQAILLKRPAWRRLIGHKSLRCTAPWPASILRQ